MWIASERTLVDELPAPSMRVLRNLKRREEAATAVDSGVEELPNAMI
jgi:hypothetical protein